MKKLITIVLFLLVLKGFTQEQIVLEKPVIDERVELLSTVFRLAGNNEYTMRMFENYVERIDSYFEPYKDHELIAFAKKLNNEKGVGFDAVMKMAIHIGPAPEFEPLVPFTDSIPDHRWGRENALHFCKLLKKFYQDTRFKTFFTENKWLYNDAIDRFSEVYELLDINWYSEFYGQAPKEKFMIVIGLGNGGASYGPDIVYENGNRTVYSILGTWKTDSAGYPVYFPKVYLPTLLHEFNHSFINHLTAKYRKELEESGLSIFQDMKIIMKSQGYTSWESMMNEFLVRAAVVKYMIDHQFEKEQIENEISSQKDKGYFWIEQLIEELNKYENSRSQYASLDSYMPQIVSFYNHLSQNREQYLAELEKRRPRVLSISEFKNGIQNLDPSVETITINFDRPLKGRGYSISCGEAGKEYIPDIKDIKYTDDNESVIIKVKLEENKQYELVLTGLEFKSKKNIPIENYKVYFKTK